MDKYLGEFYVLSEPEFIGKIPVRTDITIIDADNKDNRKLGFKCYEYQGCEILRRKKEYKDISIEEINKNMQEVYYFHKCKYLEPIKDKDSLKENDEVVVPRLMGYDFANIIKNEDGTLKAETSYSVFPLEYGKDDRSCWVCAMEINKKCFDLPIYV